MEPTILVQKRKEYKELDAQRKSLLEATNVDEEGMKSIAEIGEKCAKLASDIQVLVKAQKDSEESSHFMTHSVGEEAEQNGVEETPDEVRPDIKNVLGMGKAGQTVIERMGMNRFGILDEMGFGILSEKQMAAVSTKSYRDAFNNYIRKGLAGISGTERKALEEGLDPQGGYFVTPEFISRLITRLAAPMRVQGRVTQLKTGRDKLSMPRVNYEDANDIYTTGFRVTWTGENPTSGTVHRVDDANLFGRTTIDVYTAMLSSVLTKDMVEDSDFPVMSFVADKFAETISILRDNMILLGTGMDQPLGILTNPGGTGQPEVIQSGVANSFSADNIRQFPFELPEQYINENAAWVMNRANCGKYIAGLKDGENRYLFARGSNDDKLVTPHPDMLDGYPMIYSAFMPDIGDGAHPIIFGDLAGYFLVNRIGLSVTFYSDSAYDQLNQVGVGGRVRFGGKTAEEFRMKILKSDNA